MLNKKFSVMTATLLSLISLSFVSFDAAAKRGVSGGDTKVRKDFPTQIASGSCSAPVGLSTEPPPLDIQTQAAVRKSQNVWQFSMETSGAASEGEWAITFTNNGVTDLETSVLFEPPGGWSVVGYNLSDGGSYNLQARAIKTSSYNHDNTVGTVCNAEITFKF